MHANKWMGKQLLSRRTLLGLFAKTLRNEIAELDREILCWQLRRHIVDDLRQKHKIVGPRISCVRILPKSTLNQRDPKRPDVRSKRIRFASQSLRRHVCMSADECGTHLLGRIELSRKAEIGNFDLPTAIQKDVTRFHIPVHLMTLPMQIVQAGKHSCSQFPYDQLGKWARTGELGSMQHICKGPPFHIPVFGEEGWVKQILRASRFEANGKYSSTIYIAPSSYRQS